MNYEPSNILHAYCNFLQTRQPPYNLVIMSLPYYICSCITEKILHLIDDITTILAKDDNGL
jgi:hypothetical protein